MDMAFTENLDQYISKLQRLSKELNGTRATNPLKVKRDLGAIALKSARLFLAYSALVALVRRNVGPISETSCVGLITVPPNWPLVDIKEAAKLIFKEEKVRFCLHPVSKGRRGWDIDPAEHLTSRKLLVFVQAGSSIHEDFEVAATFEDRLALCKPRHLRALGHLRGCGDVSSDQAILIAQQPSERMEAIFRIGQPAQRAAQRLSPQGDGGRGTTGTKPFDISKGFGEASVWALELIKDVQDWRNGKLPWSEVDKGCLLYGPPGTGKTRFAVALAAVGGVHLEVASVSKWQSNRDGALGDMLQAMYKSFASAKENAPSILFIDEVDSIGDRSKFPARHANYSTQVVNGLLECLDGVEGREGVIVVGACNNPEKIDPAVLRGGRLEKHIHFALPDAGARADILAFHLPTLAEEPGLKEIAARLPEKSGADLERLSREARRIARREQRPVSVDDLRSKIAPLPVLNQGHQLQIAIHEAGHALVAHALRVGIVERVEIFDNIRSFATEADAHGITVIAYPTSPFATKWEKRNLIAMHLAGAAAEEVFFQDRSNMSSGFETSDFARATSVAIEMVSKFGWGSTPYFLPNSVDPNSPSELWRDERLEAEVTEILQTEYSRVTDMLSGLQHTLVTFAVELAKHKKLQGVRLEKLWPGPKASDDTETRKC